MRVTTSAILRNYKSSLSNASKNVDAARTIVMNDGRIFSRASDNPQAASRVASLERKYMANDDYISMVDEVQGWQDEQENALMQINSYAQQVSKDYSLEALNGTNAAQRSIYATNLRELQNSMVKALNSNFQGKFVLAGTDGQNLPFVLSEDGKTLTYRGIDVDTANPADYDKLESYANEHMYVDMGFGLELDAHADAVPSSVFDTALSGISVVGFGTDSSGMSNNMISLVGQMAELLEDGENMDEEAYGKLLEKFDEGHDKVVNTSALLGTKTNLLKSTKSNLQDYKISLTEQMKNVGYMDQAEAIMNMSAAQYAYTAALKVGTSILSPSLLDFMG